MENETDLEFELIWGRPPNRFESAVHFERQVFQPVADAGFIPWLPDTRWYRRECRRLLRQKASAS